MRDATEIVFALLVIITIVLMANIVVAGRFGQTWLFASVPTTTVLGLSALYAFAQIEN